MADPYGENNLTTLAKRLQPFMLSTAMVAAAASAVKIIVYHRDGAPAEYFDVDDAGWDLAAAACRSYDTIVSPPALFTSDHTIPDNVAYLGAGTLSTVHTGKLTSGAGSYLRDVAITRAANDANELIALAGPGSGESYTNTININITQSGSGDATGIKMGAGTLKIRSNYISATTEGAGTAAALYGSSGDAWILQCELFGNAGTAGAGYGIVEHTGEIGMYGGWLYGDTLPAIKLFGDPTDLFYSSTAVKALSLWNGVDNDSPPVGWYEQSYDDSAWGTAVAGNHTAGLPPTGSTAIWTHDTASVGYIEEAVFRHEFILPAGVIFGATLYYRTSEKTYGVWINDEWVYEDLDYNREVEDEDEPGITGVAVDPSYLQAGDNVLAAWVMMDGPSNRWAAWRLEVSYLDTTDTTILASAVRMDPVMGIPVLGDRGAWDVANYGTVHASDWTAGDSHHAAVTLASGSPGAITGQEIDLSGIGVVTVRKDSGADIGTRPRLNFIQGSNVTLTVADDAANDEVDITIASSGGGGGSASGGLNVYLNLNFK